MKYAALAEAMKTGNTRDGYQLYNYDTKKAEYMKLEDIKKLEYEDIVGLIVRPYRINKTQFFKNLPVWKAAECDFNTKILIKIHLIGKKEFYILSDVCGRTTVLDKTDFETYVRDGNTLCGVDYNSKRNIIRTSRAIPRIRIA